jgi:hypothetical protein
LSNKELSNIPTFPIKSCAFLLQDGTSLRRRGHSSRRPDPEAEDEVGGQTSKVLRHLRQVRRLQEVEHQAQKTKATSSELIYQR